MNFFIYILSRKLSFCPCSKKCTCTKNGPQNCRESGPYLHLHVHMYMRVSMHIWIVAPRGLFKALQDSRSLLRGCQLLWPVTRPCLFLCYTQFCLLTRPDLDPSGTWPLACFLTPHLAPGPWVLLHGKIQFFCLPELTTGGCATPCPVLPCHQSRGTNRIGAVREKFENSKIRKSKNSKERKSKKKNKNMKILKIRNNIYY